MLFLMHKKTSYHDKKSHPFNPADLNVIFSEP